MQRKFWGKNFFGSTQYCLVFKTPFRHFPYTFQTVFRHLPDTFQKTFRHHLVIGIGQPLDQSSGQDDLTGHCFTDRPSLFHLLLAKNSYLACPHPRGTPISACYLCYTGRFTMIDTKSFLNNFDSKAPYELKLLPYFH